MMDEKGRTRVGLVSPRKPYYNLLTQIPGKSREYQIYPQLGKSRRQTIQEEIQRLSEGILKIKKLQKTQQKTKQKEIKPLKEQKCKFHPG